MRRNFWKVLSACLFSESQALCMAQFHIGHRLALNDEPNEATTPLVAATQLCPKTTFEYHAAQKWLKRLTQ